MNPDINLKRKVDDHSFLGGKSGLSDQPDFTQFKNGTNLGESDRPRKKLRVSLRIPPPAEKTPEIPQSNESGTNGVSRNPSDLSTKVSRMETSPNNDSELDTIYAEIIDLVELESGPTGQVNSGTVSPSTKDSPTTLQYSGPVPDPSQSKDDLKSSTTKFDSIKLYDSKSVVFTSALECCEYINIKYPSLKKSNGWNMFVFSQGIETIYKIKSNGLAINIGDFALWHFKSKNNAIHKAFEAKKNMGVSDVNPLLKGSLNKNVFDMGDSMPLISSIFFVYGTFVAPRDYEIFARALVYLGCLNDVISAIHLYEPDSFDSFWNAAYNVFVADIKSNAKLPVVLTFPEFCRNADRYGKTIDPKILQLYLYCFPYESIKLDDSRKVFPLYKEEWMIVNSLLWKHNDIMEMKRVGKARREQNPFNKLFKELNEI